MRLCTGCWTWKSWASSANGWRGRRSMNLNITRVKKLNPPSRVQQCDSLHVADCLDVFCLTLASLGGGHGRGFSSLKATFVQVWLSSSTIKDNSRSSGALQHKKNVFFSILGAVLIFFLFILTFSGPPPLHSNPRKLGPKNILRSRSIYKALTFWSPDLSWWWLGTSRDPDRLTMMSSKGVWGFHSFAWFSVFRFHSKIVQN